MKPTELFGAGVYELKNRLPFSAISKFKKQKFEGQSGKAVLSNCISRHNCRLIPIISLIFIIGTFAAAFIEVSVTDGGISELLGEILLLVTSVFGIGFGFYFSGRYPYPYPYIFWAGYTLSYCIKLTDCVTGAAGLSQTIIAIALISVIPIFPPAANALFLGVISAFYSALCAINDISSYYSFVVITAAALGFIVSCTVYSLFCVSMISSRKIKDDERRIKLNSRIDSFTDMYNRSYGIERTSAMLKNKTPVAILLVDIDYFGEYNRRYGTEKADEALSRISKCVKIIAKTATDIICRFENDRFLICMPADNDKAAVYKSEEIRTSIKTMDIPFPESKVFGCVTVTVSAARSTSEDNFDTLYERAELSMEAAKRHGRNCIGFREHAFRSETDSQ